MNKLAVCLTLALPLALMTLPASAKGANGEGFRTHKAMKHSVYKTSRHGRHAFAMHKGRKAMPSTTGMGTGPYPIQRSLDNPRVYGKPNRH